MDVDRLEERSASRDREDRGQKIGRSQDDAHRDVLGSASVDGDRRGGSCRKIMVSFETGPAMWMFISSVFTPVSMIDAAPLLSTAERERRTS